MKIRQIKKIFPEIEVARYNLGAWQSLKNGSLCLIGREVTNAADFGQPDTGTLKLFETREDGKITHERVVWKPTHDGISLEDPRVLQLPDDKLIIGLTCVVRDKKGVTVPFPALVKIDNISSWRESLPPFMVIDTFGPGKNITPMDSSTYLFRPNANQYYHKILVFSLASQAPKKLGDIVFPKNLPWAKWRIGTTMPPIWITPNEALFIIHGITIKQIDGVEKYIYAIGRAKLVRNKNKFNVVVAPKPILTSDNFLNEGGTPMVHELHPELRRVVYSTGGIIKKGKEDLLDLYVNVGDRATFEVEFSLKELRAGLF